MSTAIYRSYVVDNATHVISASARLLILGGVEKGRGGIFSPISRIDGGPHRRTAIGNMSGISSGTGETGCSFVLLSAACACGKYDARGVGVGEDATSTGVLVSAPSNRSLVCIKALECDPTYLPMGEHKDSHRCRGKHHPWSAGRLPLSGQEVSLELIHV